MPSQPSYAFGPFALDPAGRSLALHGVPVPLRPKTFELLECLLERAGRVVTKAELIAALWPDGDVTEQNLAQQVFLLRSALSEHAPRQAFIVTEPGRGYRFVAPLDVRPARDTPRGELERLYLRGRYHWEKRTRAGLREAQACFERAIARDPAFAPAHSGLASTFMLRGEFLHEHPDRAFPPARREAQRALELDPKSPEAHTVLGDVALFYDRDLDGAERHFDDALAYDARFRTARLFHAWLCIVRGRYAQARIEVETALADAPYDLPLQLTLGVTSLYERDCANAITQLRFVLELEPSYHLATYNLAAALVTQGDYAEALSVLETDDTGERVQSNAATGAFAAYRLGDEERGRAYEHAIDQLAAGGEYVSAFNRAQVALGKRDTAAAVAAIAAGAAENDPWVVFIPEHPLFAEELRAEPRYHRIVDRIARGRLSYGT